MNKPYRGTPPSDTAREVSVADLVAVDDADDGSWRSRRCDPRGGRMYGGALAAQLLAAARATTAPHMQVSSVDVRYVRPADGARPVEYRVEAVQDGNSSSLRRVIAQQGDVVVAIGSAGFHTPRPGWEHGQRSTSFGPDDLPITGTPHRSRAVTGMDFDIRYRDVTDDGALTRVLWFRTVRAQPQTAQLHECALVYVSDIYFFEPLCLEHGIAGDDPKLRYATTQHTVWFHRPPKVDEWLVLESFSPAVAGGRGVVCGSVRTIDGQPVATVVQEAVCWIASA